MGKRRRVLIGGGAAFLFILFFSCSSAYALKISPGAFCAQNVEVGKDLDLGVDLTITNDSDTEKIFVVKPVEPQKVTKTWLKGYQEIPDISWFYLSQNEITIGPNSEGKTRMYLKIPNEEKYLNQHWIVYVDVTSKPKADVAGTFGLQLAISPNYMFETKAKMDIKDKPYGVLALTPSVIKIKEVMQARKKQAQFKIYNNDQISHTYTISAYIPKTPSAKQDISITPGYEWGKVDWVKPAKKKIILKPNTAKEMSLNVLVPKALVCKDLGWEAIVFVESDKGIANFVRVLVEPGEE